VQSQTGGENPRDQIRQSVEDLLADGRRLSLQLETDIQSVEGTKPPPLEALFRRHVEAMQKIVGCRSRDFLEHEIRASDMLSQLADYDGSAPEEIHNRFHDNVMVSRISAQRGTLRLLLDTLSGRVSEIRERAESRLTDLVNITIVIMTVASIIIALGSYRIAVVTYKDAAASADEQRDATKKQIETLQKSREAMDSVAKATSAQQDLLEETARSTHAQAVFLAQQQANEREQRTLDQERARARQLSSTAQGVATYYEELASQLDATAALGRLGSSLLGIPFNEADLAVLIASSAEIRVRARAANSLAKLAGSYGERGLPGSSAGIANAARELINGIVGLKPVPSGSSVPPNAFEKSGQALIELVRSEQPSQGWEPIQRCFIAMSELFDREMPVYESVNNQRVETAESLALVLVRQMWSTLTPHSHLHWLRSAWLLERRVLKPSGSLAKTK
jgi:hypothetical protein